MFRVVLDKAFNPSMQRQPSQKTEDIGASLLEPSLYALVLRHDPILAIELRAKKSGALAPLPSASQQVNESDEIGLV
jgi:hypothetical protein